MRSNATEPIGLVWFTRSEEKKAILGKWRGVPLFDWSFKRRKCKSENLEEVGFGTSHGMESELFSFKKKPFKIYS